MTESQALVQRKAETIRQLLDNPTMRKQIQAAIPKHLTVDRLLRTVMTAVRTNPKLLDCTQKSLLASVMGCAALGLEPEPFLGQAYLVPFKKDGQPEATLIPGYRGYIALARRSGEVQSVSAQVVYANDHFVLRYGTDEKLEHIPADGDRGNVRGAYVVFKYKDGSHSFDYMSDEDIMKIARRSKTYDEKKGAWTGPWQTDPDEMRKKTVIRRHVKIAPLAVEIQKAAALEDRAMAGESQFDMVFPELPEGEQPALPENGRTFDEYLGDVSGVYNKEHLSAFLDETAKANNCTVDQIKEEAAKRFSEFWEMYERWEEKNKATGKEGQEPTTKTEEKSELDPTKNAKAAKETKGDGKESYVECPEKELNGRKAKVSASYCEKMCEKRKGCPVWPER